MRFSEVECICDDAVHPELESITLRTGNGAHPLNHRGSSFYRLTD